MRQHTEMYGYPPSFAVARHADTWTWVHELGHTFGLMHEKSPNFMAQSKDVSSKVEYGTMTANQIQTIRNSPYVTDAPIIGPGLP